MRESSRLCTVSVFLALLAFTVEASAEGTHRVRFEAQPDTLLLLDGESADGSTFGPSRANVEETSYVRACAGPCTFEAAPGTYTAWVVANNGQRIPEATDHSLPPISGSEPQRLELTGPASLVSSTESYAGRRTAATIVLALGFGAGLGLGGYGIGMGKPVFIGLGAASIVGAYTGYYLLRKEGEVTLSIAPLQAALAFPFHAAEVTDTPRALTDTTLAARGAALTLSF